MIKIKVITERAHIHIKMLLIIHMIKTQSIVISAILQYHSTNYHLGFLWQASSKSEGTMQWNSGQKEFRFSDIWAYP